MKKILSILILILTAGMPRVMAEIPYEINYQGHLTDAAGEPLEGTYGFMFRIFAEESGGTALWSEYHNSVYVEGGVFHVILGSNIPIDWLQRA